MSNEKFKVKFGLAVGDTVATIDGTTGNIYTSGDATVNSNLQVNGSTTLGNDILVDTVAVNGLVTGDITFSNNSSTTQRGIYGTVGANDYWKFGGGASSGTDTGFAAIVTGDNGTEPIYVQQYNGASVAHQMTLLDASGNTVLGGDLTVGGSGYIYSSTDLALDLTGANVRVVGDLTVDGGDIITTTSSANIANTTSTTVNIGGAATTVSIGANTGTTTINNSLVADDISILTVDTTNLEVTNIKAKDGTAAATIADSTGIITVSSQLNVDNLNFSGNSIISTDTNGNITLAPNGTGNVVNTFSNGGNLTNNRNYVFGAIRNATTAAAGDIWAFNATGTVGPLRGISLDNSADTTRNAGEVIRGYSGSAANGQRGRLVFEKARNTAASPTANQAADTLASIEATGYTSTGWVNDTIPVSPGLALFVCNENWVSNTNLGTGYVLNLAPTATTISTATNLVQALNISPQLNQSRSDAFTWGTGKSATTFTATGSSISGTTLTIGTVTAGTVAVGQFIQTATNGISFGTYIVSNISGSGSGSTWVVSQSQSVASTTITGTSGSMYLNNSGNLDVLGNVLVRGSSILGTNAGSNYASITPGSATFTVSGINNFIRQGTVNTTQPALLVRYQRTDTTGSNDGDGVDFRLSTAGTSTTNNIARFDAQYRTSGLHTVGISVSTDSFTADTDTIYRGQADKTAIRAAPTGTTGTASDILTIESTKVASAVPIAFPVYTAAAANAITGAAGWQICISNSASGSNPNGMMAFWDTTNSRWSYIHDNSAV